MESEVALSTRSRSSVRSKAGICARGEITTVILSLPGGVGMAPYASKIENSELPPLKRLLLRTPA